MQERHFGASSSYVTCVKLFVQPAQNLLATFCELQMPSRLIIVIYSIYIIYALNNFQMSYTSGRANYVSHLLLLCFTCVYLLYYLVVFLKLLLIMCHPQMVLKHTSKNIRAMVSNKSMWSNLYLFNILSQFRHFTALLLWFLIWNGLFPFSVKSVFSKQNK